MTTLGKSVVISGLIVFTTGTLAWIITHSWEWFAGGLSLFVSSIIASAVLSVETKQTNNHHHQNTRYTPNELTEPSHEEVDYDDTSPPSPKTL